MSPSMRMVCNSVRTAAGVEADFRRAGVLAYYETMFSTLFITLADIEALCDQRYGEGGLG